MARSEDAPKGLAKDQAEVSCGKEPTMRPDDFQGLAEGGVRLRRSEVRAPAKPAGAVGVENPGQQSDGVRPGKVPSPLGHVVQPGDLDEDTWDRS